MGRVIKFGGENMNVQGETVARLKAFAVGEATWAEVEGTTFEEAKAIAQVGCELAAAGRLEEARVIFEGLVEGNPKDAAAQAALGTVYQRLGRLDEAVAHYTASLEQDARNPVALAHRGELRLKRSEREGFTDLAKAVEADPYGETNAGRRAKALIRAITLYALDQSRGVSTPGRT